MTDGTTPATWRKIMCSVCGHQLKLHDPICGALIRRPLPKPKHATGYVRGTVWFERCVCLGPRIEKSVFDRDHAQNPPISTAETP